MCKKVFWSCVFNLGNQLRYVIMYVRAQRLNSKMLSEYNQKKLGWLYRLVAIMYCIKYVTIYIIKGYRACEYAGRNEEICRTHGLRLKAIK